MQKNLDNIVSGEKSSFSMSQRIKAAFGSVLTLAFLTYSTRAVAQQTKNNELNSQRSPITTQQKIKKETIPPLRVNFYNRDNEMYKTENLHFVNGKLEPDLQCKEGDTLEFVDGRIKDKNVPVVVNGKEMDLLMRKEKPNGELGDYLTNPEPMEGKGSRAIPSTFNTQALGMHRGDYDYYATLEAIGKIILASARGRLTVTPLVPVYPSRINATPEGKPKGSPKAPETGEPSRPAPKGEPKKKTECRGATSITIEGIYTGNKSAGATISVDAWINDYLAFGLGVGATVPVKNGEIETVIQQDEYDIGFPVIGKTTLQTQKEFENQELFAKLVIGKPRHINLGLRAGVSRNTYRGSNAFVQTVENAQTNEILDQNVCKAGDYKVTKYGLFLGGEFILPFTCHAGLSLGADYIENLPTELKVPYNNGSSSATVRLGKRTTWEARMGVKFIF